MKPEFIRITIEHDKYTANLVDALHCLAFYRPCIEHYAKQTEHIVDSCGDRLKSFTRNHVIRDIELANTSTYNERIRSVAYACAFCYAHETSTCSVRLASGMERREG